MRDPNALWFNTPDTHTLCRAGGNGPNHPSQLYAIKKYVFPKLTRTDAMTLLDLGSGSGTTIEALLKEMNGVLFPLEYKGLDFIPKNVEWCVSQFPEADFDVDDAEHTREADKSWDVVYSRHVVDHLSSFEIGLDEHCRISKWLVIIVLWRPLGSQDEHEIKPIVDQGKTYPDEFTNDYSRKKVMEALEKKEREGWKVLEVAEGVGREVKGHDTVIVLERK